MSRPGARVAWGSLLAGLASCVTLPLAVYLTRFSDSYELLHAGLAIPVAVGLALVALAASRHGRARNRLSLGRDGGGGGIATAGRVLGIVGLCMAASAIVALAVYGLLEYVGSRD